MGEPSATGSLQLHSGHSFGHVSVSWARLDGTWVAITGGSDGKIVARHPRQAQELKAATNNDKAPVHSLSITQDSSTAATADEKGYVRVSPYLGYCCCCHCAQHHAAATTTQCRSQNTDLWQTTTTV
jgi:hypothetical protein